MPIIKKIVEVGGAKAVLLPKTWIQFFELKYNCRLEKVAMEINEVLKIYPLLPGTEIKGGEAKDG